MEGLCFAPLVTKYLAKEDSIAFGIAVERKEDKFP